MTEAQKPTTQLVSSTAYLRGEVIAAIAVNSVLSLVFFLLTFGLQAAIPMWGRGNYLFDFAPQSFAVALMSVLVPGALTARRLAAGKFEPLRGKQPIPRSLILRALLVAVVATGFGVALAWIVIALSGAQQIGWTAALIIKIIYGGILGGIVARITLPAAMTAR